MISKDIVLQTIVIPKEQCEYKELYYRLKGLGTINDGCLILQKKAILSTLTYMNSFDSWAWNKYTGIDRWKLALSVLGRFVLRLYHWEDGKKIVIEKEIIAKSRESVSIDFKQLQNSNLIFFEIEALETTYVYKAEYRAEITNREVEPVHLSLLICTYKRKKELKKSLAVFNNSKFLDKNSPYYGGASLRIIDNASELPIIQKEFIKLYHNPNTGGSGGFTRGIIESRKDESTYGISHVVFMDDDAVVEEESFYRLYALLSLLKPCYQNEVVAGRMFDLNKGYMQYTASEVWNKGDIRHVGFKRDMRKIKELSWMNRSLGQYSGWWFACYPMSFVREETPLPFFLHCDDVEYGLRHGGTPIVLNGIQVWHETYENRRTPFISYYDTRNTMIVNTIYYQYQSEDEILIKWYLNLIYAWRGKEYYKMYPSLIALKDYLKGREHFMMEASKKEGLSLPPSIGMTIAIFMGVVQFPIFRYKLRKAFLSYKEINKNI